MSKQREALELARKYIERECEHVDYGYMRTDNPNDFCPDHDSCTDDEIAAHKAACDAYDKGEYDPSETAHSETQVDANGEVVRHILRAPWGIGTYRWRDPEGEDAIAAIDAASAEIRNLRKRNEDTDRRLSLVLHELAGAASLCWEPNPSGVFDTGRALGFVEEAINELRATLRGQQPKE